MDAEQIAAKNGAGTDEGGRDLRRTVGFWGACGVMIGVIIGSGIFRTPTAIADELSSPGLILLLWLVGGLLALAGALTFAELAAMHPSSGGVYVFIREGYGRCAAFVFGWTYMLITKPSAAGGIAFIFAAHLNYVLGWVGLPAVDEKWATTAMLVVLTLVNVRGTALSAGVAVVLTSLKFGALALIVLTALVLLGGETGRIENFAGTPAPPPEPGITGFVAALVPVLAAIMWTYDGWSDVGAIAGEVKDPQRTLPRVYVCGAAAVTALYLAVNAVYLWIIPLAEMREMTTVAPEVMGRLLGGVGSAVVVVVVLVSTLGSTHSSIMTGARVTYAQARDGLMFGPLGHVHGRWATPDVALLVQMGLSITAVWVLGNFQSMAESFVFTMWIFYGLAGAAIFVLRTRDGGRERPYRCWGYPVVPALFVMVSAGMTMLSVWSDWKTTVPWLAVLAAGVPVYYAWEWARGRQQATGNGERGLSRR